MVVQGSFPQRRGAGPALRALRIHTHRRHIPQHGRQLRRGGNHTRHPPLEDHVPCDASHDKARNTLHHTSGIRQRNGQLSRAALPWPCDALHKVRVAELQIHGRGQHFSHTDDDIRRGDTASKPDKRKKQKELYHGHRQVRPDIQIQPGQIRQVHHSYNTYNNNLFYKHIPHSVLRL